MKYVTFVCCFQSDFEMNTDWSNYKAYLSLRWWSFLVAWGLFWHRLISGNPVALRFPSQESSKVQSCPHRSDLGCFPARALFQTLCLFSLCNSLNNSFPFLAVCRWWWPLVPAEPSVSPPAEGFGGIGLKMIAIESGATVTFLLTDFRSLVGVFWDIVPDWSVVQFLINHQTLMGIDKITSNKFREVHMQETVWQNPNHRTSTNGMKSESCMHGDRIPYPYRRTQRYALPTEYGRSTKEYIVNKAPTDGYACAPVSISLIPKLQWFWIAFCTIWNWIFLSFLLYSKWKIILRPSALHEKEKILLFLYLSKQKRVNMFTL